MAITNSANTYAGFPKGLTVAKCDVVLQADGAVTKGDVLAVDASSITLDGDYCAFTKTSTPAATNSENVEGIGNGLFVVALESAADGKLVKCRAQGVVDATINGTPGAGATVTVNVSKKMTLAVTNDKVVGFMLEAGENDKQKKVMFDGINGFGVRGA